MNDPVNHHHRLRKLHHETDQPAAPAPEPRPALGQFGDYVFRPLPRPSAQAANKTRLPLKPSNGKRSFRVPGGGEGGGGGGDGGQDEVDMAFADFVQACGGDGGGRGSRGGGGGQSEGDEPDGQQRGRENSGEDKKVDEKSEGKGSRKPSEVGQAAATNASTEVALAGRKPMTQEEAALALTMQLLSLVWQPQSAESSLLVSLQLATMAGYIKQAQEREGGLRTLGRVKEKLLHARGATSPTSDGAERAGGKAAPASQATKDHLALLPLQLLACDRPRTERQRKVAVDRLRTAAKRRPSQRRPA